MIPQPRRISVVVPTYNRPALLQQALASIRAHEGALYSFEILVADNGTAPDTPDVAKAYGAIYIKVDRPGAGAARNAGLQAVSGDYVTFLDDDDVWLPTHLGSHFELLDAKPEIEAVIGQVIYTDQDLKPLGEPWPPDAPPSGQDLLKKVLSDYLPQIGTLVARVCIIASIGNFDETLIGGQDLEWVLRIARRRTMAFVPTPCLLFRGRPYQTYDALQFQRLHFARKVFFRHAIPEWRLWPSPTAFLKAYRVRIWHFYNYFVDSTISRAEAGDRKGAMRAFLGAYRVFALRAGYDTMMYKPLRKAALTLLTPQRRGTVPSGAAKD